MAQWPLPRRAVLRALDRLPSQLAPWLADARDAVLRELRDAQAAEGSASLRNPRETLVGFGDDETPGSALTLRSSTLGGERASAQLGLRAERSGEEESKPVALRLEGSAAAAEALGVQLQGWSHRTWWGPGWQNSLILGNNAPALVGAGFQRAQVATSESPWLAWLGPWNFEFFVAGLDGVQQPRNPYFIGTRLSVKPFSFFELGFTRTAQWGGRGRETSARGFVDMLLGRHLNADTTAEEKVDPANEMAGFDVRARCPFGWHCAGYVQVIGEDQAGRLPSRTLGLYGLELWSQDGLRRGYVELAETGCRMPVGNSALKGCAYRNYAYPEGYVDERRWLGAGVGPDSRLLTVGWLDAGSGLSLKLHYGKVNSRIAEFSPVVDDPDHGGTVLGATARTSWAWHGLVLEPELGWIEVQARNRTQRDPRIGLTVHVPLDAAR